MDQGGSHTPGLESHLQCPLLWNSPLLAGDKPDHGRKPPLQEPWCWIFPSHPAASISLMLSGSSCTWNWRPELFHSPASSPANPSELGMGTKLSLQQQRGPSSPSHLLSPLCCSFFLRGKEGEHFSLPQWVQPHLASLQAHPVLVGCGCLPFPVSPKCCSFPSPVPAMALAHSLCCHSEDPVPEYLAKGKLAIIIKKTHNRPRHIMQPGKESKAERAWLASKSCSTCLSTQ